MAEGQNVGSVNVRLGLDLATFTTALAQATRQLETFGTRAGRSTQAGAQSMGAGFQAMQGPAKAAVSSIGEVQTAIGALGAAFAGFQAANFIQGLALTAARTEVLETVLGQVAKTAGVSTATTRPLVEQMKRLGITTQEANLTTTKFIQNRLDLNKALQLARVAQDAATISGQNSSESLSGMLHAITTLQPEVLRTYGLIVNMESATAAWAVANKRSVDSISAAERQQIFLNETLKAGVAIQGVYAAGMGDVSKQIQSLARLQEEAANVLGRAYLPALRRTVTGLSGLLTGLTKMDPAWQDLTSGAIASGTSLVALTAILGTLTIGAQAAWKAMTPVGVAVVGISAAVSTGIGLWTTYQAAQERATQGTRDLQKDFTEVERALAELTGPTDKIIEGFKALALNTARTDAQTLAMTVRIQELSKRFPELEAVLAKTDGSTKARAEATLTWTQGIERQTDAVLAAGTAWQQLWEGMTKAFAMMHGGDPLTAGAAIASRQAQRAREQAQRDKETLRLRQMETGEPIVPGLAPGVLEAASARARTFQRDLELQALDAAKTGATQRATLEVDLAQARGQTQEAELEQRLERQKQAIQQEFAQASQGVADLTALMRERDRRLAEAENAGAQARKTIQLQTLDDTTAATRRGIEAQLTALKAAQADLPRLFPQPGMPPDNPDAAWIAQAQKQTRDRQKEEERLANERAKLEGDLTTLKATETAKRTQIETGAVQAQGKLQQTLSEQTQAQLQERTQAWAAYGQTLQGLSRALTESADSANLFRAAALTPDQAADATLNELAERVSAWTQARSRLQEQLADPKTLGDPALVAELTTKVQTLGGAITEAQRTLLQGQATKAWADWGTALSRDVELLGLEVSLAGKSRRERELALDIERQLQDFRAKGIDETTRPGVTADVTARLTAVSQLKEELRGLRDPIQEFLDAAEPMWVSFREAGVQALGTLEDSLVEFWSTGKFGFADFAKAIERELLRTFTREFITRPLAEGMKGLFDAIQPRDEAKLAALQQAAKGGPSDTALSTATPAVGSFSQALLGSIPSIEAFVASLKVSGGLTPPSAAPVPTADLGRWTPELTAAAQQTGLDPRLLAAVMQQESGGNPKAVSPAGAQGLMQLMPATARHLGVTNPLEPASNLLGGATYLRQLLDQFGDLSTALAAYNAGPGNVQKYGGIPPFKETQAYVPAVEATYAALGGDPSASVAQLTSAFPPLASAAQQTTAQLQPLGTTAQQVSTAWQEATGSLSPFTAAVQSATAALQALATPTPTAAIPALGQGGVVTHPTLAWIGERGPELVVPLQAGGLLQGPGASGVAAPSGRLWDALWPYLEDLLKAGRFSFGEQFLSGLIGPSAPLTPEELLGLAGPQAMGRVGVLAGHERLASAIIKRGLKEPYFHGSPAWETILREGFSPARVGAATGQRLGEPAGISLSRNPNVAAQFAGKGAFGAEGPPLLRVGVDIPPSSVGQFTDPAFIETYQRAFGLAMDAHRAGPRPDRAVPTFNAALSSELQGAGIEAIAYNPRRYGEFELRVLDPSKAVPLGTMSVPTNVLETYRRNPQALLHEIASAREELATLYTAQAGGPGIPDWIIPARLPRMIEMQTDLLATLQRQLDVLRGSPLGRYLFGNQPALHQAFEAAPPFPAHLRDIIPQFAAGGIVTQPTLGLVGEAGPEAIIPLGGGAGLEALTQPFASALNTATLPLEAFGQGLTQTLPSLERWQTALTTPTSSAPSQASGAGGAPAERLSTAATGLQDAAKALQEAAKALQEAAGGSGGGGQDQGGGGDASQMPSGYTSLMRPAQRSDFNLAFRTGDTDPIEEERLARAVMTFGEPAMRQQVAARQAREDAAWNAKSPEAQQTWTAQENAWRADYNARIPALNAAMEPTWWDKLRTQVTGMHYGPSGRGGYLPLPTVEAGQAEPTMLQRLDQQAATQGLSLTQMLQERYGGQAWAQGLPPAGGAQDAAAAQLGTAAEGLQSASGDLRSASQQSSSALTSSASALQTSATQLQSSASALQTSGQMGGGGMSGAGLAPPMGDFSGSGAPALSTGPSGSDFAPMTISPDLEAYARGGIVTKPTLAWIGERGPEAIIPLAAGGTATPTGLAGVQAALPGIGGAVGAMVVPMLYQELMNALFGSPEDRQKAFEKAQRQYQIAFSEMIDPYTGHILMGKSRDKGFESEGIDAFERLDWPSKVKGAAGYLRPPVFEEPSLFENLVRSLGSILGMQGGSKLGGMGGSALAGLFGGSSGGTMTAGSGAEGAATAMAASGGTFGRPTMALIGEAGPEAVIPLRGGRIPTLRTAAGLVATMPSGARVPLATPQVPGFALGGVVGSPAPSPRVGASAWREPTGGGWGGGGPTVIQHIQTPDLASFKASQAQLANQTALALKRIQKRNG
jgi:soluble lytic murein transglycosylase-like protein